jgi:hypothetical protein
MGTRSMIAIQNPHSKQVRAVYCHWDGYLEHNGAILQKHYAASPKVNNLIALGDISSLRPEIGEKHAFSRLEVPMDDEAYNKLYGDMTTYYGRDRGESNAEFRVFKNLADACEFYDHSGAEYYYVYKYTKASDYTTGEWHYKKPGDRWKKLAPAIRKLSADECAA